MPQEEVNHCGNCTACCRVFSIPAPLNKPAGKWCQHCEIGHGCRIYPQRPSHCREFACLWLQSHQRSDVPLAEELRPDRCKVVFAPTTNHGIYGATVMPGAPDAWRKGAAKELIEKMVRGGLRVVAGLPGATTRVMIDRYGEHEVKLSEPDQDGMQWEIRA